MSTARNQPAFPGLGLSRFSLHQQFVAALCIVMACSLLLGIGLITRYHEQLDTSRDNLERLAAFRLVLDAASRISAERGPSNRVLSEERTAAGASRQLLRDARAATDAALARAAANPALADGVPPLRQTLARARQRVDMVAAEPMAARTTADIAGAVEAMFGAYDSAGPLIQHSTATLLRTRTDLVGRAMAMRMLAELRDYAGRLGSHLIIPMIHGEPMDAARRTAYEETRGQVMELWHLVSQLTATTADPAVAAAHRAVIARFLGEGMALLEQTLAAGAAGRYTTTPTMFTAALVPTFAPLEQLRDAFVDSSMASLRADASAARRALFNVATATVLALLLELWLLLATEKLLFRPLLTARTRIVDFADGQFGAAIEQPRAGGEIAELYQALASLRDKLIERAALTEGFRQQAQTDALTGVLNRRALDALGERLAEAGDGSRRLGAIILDIDHFKRINDTWGHGAGDEVLKELAHRLRACLRPEDILARFGGEEFVVIPIDDGSNTFDIAERLRSTLEETPFTLESGQSLQVTASFGVATADIRPGIWPHLIAAADHALYRAKEAGRNRVEMQSLD
ncbi:GGDEF domain-containing protein [Pigmentiphaga soli]|uniref:diguanylate cyclase n=1 Tax=Pigmentiphaga soli TaxID=1007095 RepID=A0ABP8GLX9_9BURK